MEREFTVWLRQVQGQHSYWLTRFLILRVLGFVYLAAYLSLALQVLPLIGSHGLTPADNFLSRVALHFGSRTNGFLEMPTLFWFGISDSGLLAWSWIGVALSALMLFGYANAILIGILWALYMSFVAVGQDWYGYGWEIQLLETSVLAMFLCPLLDGRPFPKRPPPVFIIWLFRWLGFRIMLGAA